MFTQFNFHFFLSHNIYNVFFFGKKKKVIYIDTVGGIVFQNKKKSILYIYNTYCVFLVVENCLSLCKKLFCLDEM
jgi:hypothetical protein